jgi:ankyrin repeat protein
MSLEQQLVNAASQGQTERVQTLLDLGADINCWEGMALRKAANKGDKITTALLLERGAKVDAGRGGAMEAAAKNNDVDMILLLAASGADLDRSPRAREVIGEAIVEAAQSGETASLQNLLRAAKTLLPETQTAALSEAASQGHTKNIALLLEVQKPERRAMQGALAWAARNGHQACVEEILQRGIPPEDMIVALRWAASQNREQIVEMLIAQGANPQAEHHGALRWAVGKCTRIILGHYPQKTLQAMSRDPQLKTGYPELVAKANEEILRRRCHQAERIQAQEPIIEP